MPTNSQEFKSMKIYLLKFLRMQIKMQMDTLHMYNISNSSKDVFVKQNLVKYILKLEFAAYQKSPEKEPKQPVV